MFRGCALKAGPGKRAQAWVQNWVLVTHGNLRTRWNKAVPCGVQYGQVLFKLCQRKLISTLTIGRSANSAALLLYQSSPTQNHLGVLSELPVASTGETAGMTFQKQRGLNPVCPLWWPKWVQAFRKRKFCTLMRHASLVVTLVIFYAFPPWVVENQPSETVFTYYTNYK